MDKQRNTYIAIIFIIAIFFLVIDLYYFNYDFFYQLGYGSQFFENGVRKVQFNTTFLFNNPYSTRIFILLLILISIVMSKVKPKLTEKEDKNYTLILYSFFFGLSFIFLYQFYNIIGKNKITLLVIITLSFIFFLIFIYTTSQLHKLMFANLLGDRFQKSSRKFEQFKPLLNNEYSVNIKTEDGYINVVNPFRASQVVGTPGSGKTYSFLVEAIVQHISKGFSMMIYDFKFPDLSQIR